MTIVNWLLRRMGWSWHHVTGLHWLVRLVIGLLVICWLVRLVIGLLVICWLGL